MISDLTVARTALSAAGTLLSNSWKGAKPVPLFFRRPMELPVGNVPPADVVAYWVTESVRFLVTLDKKYLQYWEALVQPSVSTHMTLTLPPAAWAAAPEPRPVPPATGKMMSAPCWTKA